MSSPLIVKKYSNRRLYDTDQSRYITLDELTDTIRGGRDVRVVDAKSGEDLTQATLTQVILETSAAKLLPVPLLTRLIRMKDDALAEFFGQYVSASLDLYLSAKQGAQAVSPYFPFANLPFQAGNALAQLWNRGFGGDDAAAGGAKQRPASPPEPAPDDDVADDVAELRKELEALKQEMRAGRKTRKRS